MITKPHTAVFVTVAIFSIIFYMYFFIDIFIQPSFNQSEEKINITLLAILSG